MTNQNTENIMDDTIEKMLEKIMTSGATAGEILAQLQKLMPQFNFEEVNT